MDSNFQKNKKSRVRIFCKKVLISVVLLATVFFGPVRVLAQVQVSDVTEQKLQTDTTAQATTNSKIKLAWDKLVRALDQAAATAFKQGIHYLFNTLAYDLATWLASGGEGQQPQFITEGWGPYLSNVGSSAAGFFVDGLSKFTGFNVCEPNFNLKLKIGLGLSPMQKPEPPNCSLTQLVDNWKDFVGQKDFLNRFQYEFDPQYNDFSVAFQLFDKSIAYQDSKRTEATQERQEGQGWRSITEAISNVIKTPATAVKKASDNLQEISDLKADATYTGYAAADALASFAQTLASKLLERLKQGLASSGATINNNRQDSTSNNVYDPQGSGSYSNAAAAQSRFATFLDAGISTGGSYQILQKLSTCTNVDNPAPDECVISNNFSIAISRELTVQQAIDQGFLDGNAPFGFTGSDFQPRYNEGYPYRSLLILRAHRIIPVTWEIAAEIINRQLKGVNDGEQYTLNKLIAAYNIESTTANPNPFYHLIDPNWLLKAFDEYCNAEGYGPIISSDITTNNQRTIARDSYCADYQSCLVKDEQGNCVYGYCTEEKNIWDLNGETCPSQFNTCQIFQAPNGQAAAYLKDTLNYDGCDVSNAGCMWYCTDYSFVDGQWTCTSTSDNTTKIHFDRDVETCDQAGDGCSKFLVAPEAISYNFNLPPSNFTTGYTHITGNSYNLIPNAGIEGSNPLANWTIENSIAPVEYEIVHDDVHEGNNALKLVRPSNSTKDNSAISLILDLGQRTYGRTFIFSFWAKVSDINPGPLNNNADGVNYLDNLIGAVVRDVASPDINDVTSVNMDKSVTDGQGLTTVWKKFAVPIYFEGNNDNTSIALSLRPLQDVNKFILYDDLQLEEIDYNRAAPVVVRGMTKDQCIGTGRNNFAYSVWINNNCYQLDLESLLNRSVVNLKKAPEFLGCQGYTAERTGPGGETDRAECANYAAYCFADEVGCQAYTPEDGGPIIPGVINNQDFCPAECVGYEAYKQLPTAFETQESLAFFIPSTARQCTASEAGCDEFTNLDEVARGGEGKYYFTYLQQCVLPSDVGASCSNFYGWEGSDESGYQLKVYNLSAASDGSPKLAITDPDRQPESWGDCSADSVNTNPFCQQVYDLEGNVHYVILQNTVTCSESCQPFRRTNIGDSANLAETNCTATNGSWDAGTQSCVYKAIGSQGESCQPLAAGCRAYRGNNGSNIFTAFSDNFEDGNTLGWFTGQISSEALSINGHSIKTVSRQAITDYAFINNGICSLDNYAKCDTVSDVNCFDQATNSCRASDGQGQTCLVSFGQTACGTIGDKLLGGQTYLLSFWAKSASDSDSRASLGFADSAGHFSTVASFNITGNWQYYSFGPYIYPKDLDPSAYLVFSGASSDLYLDNIEIKQVTDYVYVVKNSWQTPRTCDQNPYVDPIVDAPQFMLGCRTYSTDDGQNYNLKSFANLCRESVVGCQALVDTQNSTSPYSQEFNSGDPLGKITVPADQVLYLANQAKFRCTNQEVGCQGMGLPELDLDKKVTGWNNVYLINNPDTYSSTLCASPQDFCQEYKTTNGLSYFKDPGQRLCEYRKNADNNDYDWYKINSSDKCPTVISPLNVVHPNGQAGFEWVGLCPSDFSGCTEYVDPISQINKNLIFNSNLKQDVDNNGPDGWVSSPVGLTTQSVKQALNLDVTKSNAYTLQIDYAQLFSQAQVSCTNITLNSFDQSMRCSGGVCNLTPPSTLTSGKVSGRFSVSSTASSPESVICSVTINFGSIKKPTAVINNTSLTETGIYYRINSTIDQQSCNGVVDQANGCVLFNDRSGVNYNNGENDISYLSFDADIVNKGAPGSCDYKSGLCDSNSIIKVKLDRICSQWLDCQTKIKTYDEDGNEKDLCIELAACDRFDDSGSGQCTHYVVSSQQLVNSKVVDFGVRKGMIVSLTAAQKDVGLIANMSGFAKAGVALDANESFEKSNTVFGFYPYNLMGQTGSIANIPNGDFEIYSADFYPIGWTPVKANSAKDSTLYRVILPGKEADTEGIKVLGNGSLKLTGGNGLLSEPIAVYPNTLYYLSADINSQNLQPGTASAFADVVDEISANSLFSSNTDVLYNKLISQVARSLPEWQNHIVLLNTGDSTSIRIKLENKPAPGTPDELAGASYFDNVRLLPILKLTDEYDPNNQIYQGWLNPVFATRSCRLYPDSDSPSCRYIDSNGIERRGWNGFCVLPDPLHPGTCLQWWPVDLIRGDQIGNLPAYSNRYPLYYCLQMTDTPKDTNSMILTRSDGLYVSTNATRWNNTYPATALEKSIQFSEVCFVPKDTLFTSVTGTGYPWMSWAYTVSKPDGWGDVDRLGDGFCISRNEPTISSTVSKNNWTVRLNFDSKNNFTGYTVSGADDDNDTSDFILDKVYFRTYQCSQVVQTVTETGSNEAWTSRISQSSDYLVPDLQYAYNAGATKDNYPPFGSSVVPNPDYDPSQWAGLVDDGGYNFGLIFNQPNKSLEEPYQPRAGMPFSCIASGDSACDNNFFVLPTILQLKVDPATAAERLKRLFARSYGLWQWNDTAHQYQVANVSALGWDIPDKLCANNIRPTTHCVEPKVAWQEQNVGYLTVLTGDASNGHFHTDSGYFSAPTIIPAGGGGTDWVLRKVCLHPNGSDPDNNVFPYFDSTNSNTGTGRYDWWTGGLTFKAYAGSAGDVSYGNDDGFGNTTYADDGFCVEVDTTNFTSQSSPEFRRSTGDKLRITVRAGDGVSGLAVDTVAISYAAYDEDANKTDFWVPVYLEYSRRLDTFAKKSDTFCISDGYCVNILSSQDAQCRVFASPDDPTGILYSDGTATDYCAVAPVVKNIKVNDKDIGKVSSLNRSGIFQVQLSFNAIVNQEQLPLTAYQINWGDSVEQISGVALRDRSDDASPYKFSHTYNYYDLLLRDLNNSDISCDATASTCTVTPKIQVIDNWGWCNSNSETVGYYTRAKNSAQTCSNSSAWAISKVSIEVGISQ